MNWLREHKRLVAGPLILLMIALALLIYLRRRPDPRIVQARELSAQLRDRNLSAEQRRDVAGKLREQMQKLPQDKRREVFAEQRKAFQERLASFFKKSRPEQIAQLNEDIKRMEQFRQQFQQSGQLVNAPPPAPQRNSEERRRQRLDNSTPEERAMRSEYFRQLAERRHQMGLPPIGPRGR